MLAEDAGLHVPTIPHERSEFRTWKVTSRFFIGSGRRSSWIAQAPPPFMPEPHTPASYHPPLNHLLVTASFGRILSNSLLNLFLPSRRVNLHPSLLPMYRGAAPIQHALIDGQQETGVCVIEMTKWKEGIDSGSIWASQRMVSIVEILYNGFCEPCNAEDPRRRGVPRVARLSRQDRRPTLGVCHARHASRQGVCY